MNKKIFIFSFLIFSAPILNAQTFSARSNHTMAVLPNNNFLTCGGVGAGGSPISACEIYNTVTNAVQSIGNMATARYLHTITVLSNGKVLIAGGFNNFGAPLQTAQVYNTNTNSWEPEINMNSPRGGHTATLISRGPDAGNVLICGGQTGAFPASITNSCEIFITSATSSPYFKAGPFMTSSRYGHTASLLPNSKILFSGGISNSGAYLITQEMYDNVQATFTAVTSLLEARAFHTAVTLNNGNVLIIGGQNGFTTQRDQFSQDPRGPTYGEGDDDVQTRQRQWTLGYVEGVEMFDSNGSRVPISGKQYEVMPYRNSRNTTILRPDGKVQLLGGYGNFPVSYFNATPVIQDNSYLYLAKTDVSQANVSSGTISVDINGIDLSRTVTGRVIEGDMFLAKPQDPATPSVEIENIKVYFGHSTSTIDSAIIDEGKFNNIVPIDNPGLITPRPYVVFTPISEGANNAISSNTSSIQFDPNPIHSDSDPTSADITDGNLRLKSLTFILPGIYAQGTELIVISGTVTLTAATIERTPSATSVGYTINFTGGTAQIINAIVTPTYQDGKLKGLVTANDVNFTNISGTIQCTSGTINSPLHPSEQVKDISITISFTSNKVYLTIPNENNPNMNISKSTAVVRQMIFADELLFSPQNAKWEFGQAYTPIFDHTTLLTPAGDIMIQGGRNCETNPLTECKRTNPILTSQNSTGVYIFYRSEKWSSGPPLNQKRAYHTSTILPGNYILTCGGSDGAKTLDSCELYDPNTDKWIFVSSMTTPRAYHTATLLPNGNVLIAGGANGNIENSPALMSAEIYYPDTKKFVKTSSMTVARMWHTATLLADGNVLVTGGTTNGLTGYLNSAEIYITTSATWVPAANTMQVATNGRAQHTATFLKNNRVLLAGGINGNGALDSSELFNPVTRSFTGSAGNMNYQRTFHTATLLKDGRVLVVGGQRGEVLDTSELYIPGSGWTSINQRNLRQRAKHTATLLPNGNVMIVGGEKASMPHNVVEGYDVDFATFQIQGFVDRRTGHTAVLTSSGYVMAIGGFDGTTYLDTTNRIYFTYSPDLDGLEYARRRQPIISTGTVFFDRNDNITLLSNTTNFHSMTEASGGGAGPRNSSFFAPRVYLNAVDNPSSFLVDLTTRIYSAYGGTNTNWEQAISSLTLRVPVNPGELPYGWYNLHVCDNAQFSEGFLIQVTSPRPSGIIANLTGSVPAGSTTTVKWTWDGGSLYSNNQADGYIIFSAADDVFISTVTLTPSVIFYQTGLPANTPASIKVGGYNMGGYSQQFVKSATYYTEANPPKDLKVEGASFETVILSWDPNNNSPWTTYELSMAVNDPYFSKNVSTPIPFSNNYTSTYTTLTTLEPNKTYYFRVRAMNGDGKITAFYPIPPNFVSTVTVGNIDNLQGTPLNVNSIRWGWASADGAEGYYLWEVTNGTYPPYSVFIGTTDSNSYIQTGLSTNTIHAFMVSAFTKTAFGDVLGPPAISTTVYTLTAQPLPGEPNVYTQVTTGSFVINWIANGNPSYTKYLVYFSSYSDFAGYSSYTVVATSLNISGLLPNYPYYSKVIALNGKDIPSAETYLGEKYTKAKPPANVRPTSITMSSVILEWDTQDNSPMTVYEVRGTTVGFNILVTTYVAFNQLFTGNKYEITGLWTNTTYYFAVEGKNRDTSAPDHFGHNTGFTQAVNYLVTPPTPEIVTLSGPAGTPPGSIGGISVPGTDTSISGVLPDGRQITITIPKDAFSYTTPIAVSNSNEDPCGWLIGGTGGHPITFRIYSDVQPKQPVILDFIYTLQEAYAGTNGIEANRNKLALIRYNELTGDKLPLDTTIDQSQRKISAKINHFSLFQLATYEPSANLSSVKISPNPFFINKGQGNITIKDMPAYSKVTIYTLNGEKVYETTANGSGVAYWPGKNKKGQFVGSGIYLCVIKSERDKKIFKIAVER